jgi:hypothetical protein
VALKLGALYACDAERVSVASNGSRQPPPHRIPDYEEMAEVLATYSNALGIAYQIRDDLNDLGASGETNDIASLRPSLLLAVAHESQGCAEGIARVGLAPAVAGRHHDHTHRITYAELKADDRARTLLETYKEEAIRCLRDLENPNLKGLLRRVIGKIFNDTEIKGWCKEFEEKNRALASSVETVGQP